MSAEDGECRDRYRALRDEVAIKYTPPLSFNKKILAS
jgi:hypothetical protein